MEMRCRSPPEEAHAVFAALIVVAALFQKRGQARLLNGVLHLRVVKRAEHRDVAADGAVEHKDVLLNDRQDVIERLRADLAQLVAVEEHLALVVVKAAKQEVQKRRFAAAGTADDGVALPHLERHVDVAQNRRALVIAKGQISDFDALAQLVCCTGRPRGRRLTPPRPRACRSGRPPP